MTDEQKMKIEELKLVHFQQTGRILRSILFPNRANGEMVWEVRLPDLIARRDAQRAGFVLRDVS